MATSFTENTSANNEWFASSGLPDYRPGTPNHYAQRLARYISNPSTVRVRTLEEYGKAPSVETIRNMRAGYLHVLASRKAARDRLIPDHVDVHGSTVSEEEVVAIVLAPQPAAVPEMGDPRFIPELPLITTRSVIVAVAKRFHLTPDDITGSSRFARHIRPRHLAATILRARGNSYPAVGRWLGNRDHSSVMNAIDVFFDKLILIEEYERAWMAFAPCMMKTVRTRAEFEALLVLK